MKRTIQAAAVLLCAAILSAAGASGALAESRSKISKVKLELYSDIQAGDSGGEVYAKISTDHCSVDSVEVVNDDGEEWRVSRSPEVEIILVADDGYYFSSSTKSNYKLSINSSDFDDVDVTSVKREDDETTAIITARLQFDGGRIDSDGKADSPDNAMWNGSGTGYGLWDEGRDAKYYQVQLMRDGSAIGDVYSVYATGYDFSSLITQPGAYRFRVRTVEYSSNDKSDWSVSNTWDVRQEDLNALLAVSGSWQRSADGSRWWWRNGDGTWPASQWRQIGGYYYYFDSDGYMCTGWITLDGVSYYLDTSGALPEGAMFANRRTPDGYWVDARGAWVPGA